MATFGFRGEALSSLCALSDMTIVTRHPSTELATKLELNNKGEIVKRTLCPRQKGTTVTLTNLFGSLPVRRREFHKNIKKEFVKMCQIMQAYGLITPGCRLIVTNQTNKGAKTTVLATNGSQSILDNIVAIFGSKQKCDLLEIKQPVEPNEVLTQDVIKSLDSSINLKDDELDNLGLHRFQFDGYISSCTHGSGRSSRDRQFYFINGRPCEPKQIIKLVNDTYHRYNAQQLPFVVLNIILDRSDVDVNLTPDKRQLFINNETILRLALKKSLLNTFGQIPSSYKIQNANVTATFKLEKTIKMGTNKKQVNPDVDENSSSSTDDDFEDRYCSQKGNPIKYANMLSQWHATGQTVESVSSEHIKRKATAIVDEITVRKNKMKKIHEYLSEEIKMDTQSCSYKSESDTDDNENPIEEQKEIIQNVPVNEITETLEETAEDTILKGNTLRIDCKVKAIDQKETTLKTERIMSEESQLEATNLTAINTESPPLFETITDDVVNNVSAEEVEELIRKPLQQTVVTLATSLNEIETLMRHEDELRKESKKKLNLDNLKFKAKIDPHKNKLAEEELEMEIKKNDFVKMEIIGQFNLGFIIVRLVDDLFIIDQHATDEKYNFETLQRKTCIQNQPLVRPQKIELSAVNEMILLDNIEVFEMNGFKFDVDLNAPPTQRVKLMAKPFSKNWEFGKEDIDELIFMLQEGVSDTKNMNTCRPSRVRAMFASRACRSSVMIGTSLSKSDMRRLVDQMGTIEHPWVGLT